MQTEVHECPKHGVSLTEAGFRCGRSTDRPGRQEVSLSLQSVVSSKQRWLTELTWTEEWSMSRPSSSSSSRPS